MMNWMKNGVTGLALVAASLIGAMAEAATAPVSIYTNDVAPTTPNGTAGGTGVTQVTDGFRMFNSDTFTIDLSPITNFNKIASFVLDLYYKGTANQANEGTWTANALLGGTAANTTLRSVVNGVVSTDYVTTDTGAGDVYAAHSQLTINWAGAAEPVSKLLTLSFTNSNTTDSSLFFFFKTSCGTCSTPYSPKLNQDQNLNTNLKVNYVSIEPLSAVPLPAGGILLLTGLGGLLIARRRKAA